MTDAGTSEVVFSFDRAPVAAWTAVDDRALGGSSRSAFALDAGFAVFSGILSLSRERGYAAVRSPAGPRDLSAFEGIEVVARGDGRRYELRLRLCPGGDGIAYEHPFDTRAGRRIVVRCPFAGFVPKFRGWRMPEAGPLDPSRVGRIGLMISDGQSGAFRLEIERISAYGR